MTSVLVCDDHAVVRSGIRMILEQTADFVVVGEAADGQAAIAEAGRLQPDVVITDLTMPLLGGLAAIPELLRAAPRTRVLVLTVHADDGYFFQALKAGAAGYLLKGTSAEDLLAALRLLVGGGVPLPPALGQRLLAEYRQRADSGPENADLLSPREREVLALIAEGRSNREIAEQLAVSVRTVERTRTNIMNKAGLQTRAELMRYAVQNGWFSSMDGR